MQKRNSRKRPSCKFGRGIGSLSCNFRESVAGTRARARARSCECKPMRVPLLLALPPIAMARCTELQQTRCSRCIRASSTLDLLAAGSRGWDYPPVVPTSERRPFVLLAPPRSSARYIGTLLQWRLINPLTQSQPFLLRSVQRLRLAKERERESAHIPE